MLKDVFRAAFVLIGIYLVCFEWYKSKQMLMMRQRIFAPNFVIFWGCKCLFRMRIGDVAELRIIFCCLKKELLAFNISQTPVGEFRSNRGKTRSLGAQTKQCHRARLSDA